MENFERQMADHTDTENRAQHGKLAKTGGVNHKLAAGMRKLSHERRAKEHTKNKPPGQMSEKEFQQFARRHMGQSED